MKGSDMKLRLDKRLPNQMTAREYLRYGDHLERVMRDACGATAHGQGAFPSDTALKRAWRAQRELRRIQWGTLYHKAMVVSEGNEDHLDWAGQP
jgi:hypothetical protein